MKLPNSGTKVVAGIRRNQCIRFVRITVSTDCGGLPWRINIDGRAKGAHRSGIAGLANPNLRLQRCVVGGGLHGPDASRATQSPQPRDH
ncbi:MAG: hypothetical protein KA914_10300 [Ottowia sp.]|jgi:hypothetical protein|nr:hypothetical protein [Ottowia sp.]